MLVLSRKKSESIVINHDITVTVVEIRGDKVRLGVVHPKEVPVHRQEVYDAIQRNSSYSAVSPEPDEPVVKDAAHPVLENSTPAIQEKVPPAFEGLRIDRFYRLQMPKEMPEAQRFADFLAGMGVAGDLSKEEILLTEAQFKRLAGHFGLSG